MASYDGRWFVEVKWGWVSWVVDKTAALRRSRPVACRPLHSPFALALCCQSLDSTEGGAAITQM